FNKENNVSGQAVKPIYVENQDNDGQTQCTEQTMELFAAVRAELQTVNAPVEDNYIFSETISSSYTEKTLQDPSYNTLFDPDSCYNQWLASLNLPLLPHPQTFYSFLKHIEQYNFSHLNIFNNALTISIKLDYSKYHIYLQHNAQLLPEHFFPQLSGYTYYPTIPIPSKFSLINNNLPNTNLIIKDNDIFDTYHQLVEFVLGGWDDTTIAERHFSNIQLDTCYNKFLSYNHLPLLPHP